MVPHKILNPVLRGFNPDPSIVRVGGDYYVATSTFEWFPGIQIHHSRDLVNWRLMGHCLYEVEQMGLRGVANSGGIWAPSLSYNDGLFWMVYTIVRTCGNGRAFKDTHNYLVTSEKINGPWSAPVYLHSCGFDASFFHDDDGRKWTVAVQWDFRKGHPRFGGIVLQEYDHKQRRVVGALKKILQKEILIEGPNLYKRDGWYYLMLAEGGTGWNHGISMARSRTIDGPYELDPEAAVLTTRNTIDWPLQKAGHGELVQTPAGEWWLAHLCSRPIGRERRCVLGRETALQRVVWREDGWLRLASGGVVPAIEVAAPAEHVPHPWPESPVRDGFDAGKRALDWTFLRRGPEDGWLSLADRRG